MTVLLNYHKCYKPAGEYFRRKTIYVSSELDYSYLILQDMGSGGGGGGGG